MTWSNRRFQAETSVWGDMMKKTTDHLPLDVGGNPKERKKHTMVLRERKRTAMIKPAAATLDVLPYSHVGGKMSKKKKKKKKKKKSSLLESEKMNQKQRRKNELLEYEVPTDIWIEILLRLPFLMLVGVRLVCRAWNDIITRWQSHHHRNLTPASLLGFSYVKHEHMQPSFKFPPPPPPTKTYLTLVDLPTAQCQRQLRRAFCPLQFKVVRHPCTLHDCSLHKTTRRYEQSAFLNLLIPKASCHGLICFIVSSFLDRIFVGNPLLNEDLLMVPGSNTNLKTAAAMETETMWNNTEDAYVSEYLVGFGFSPKINSYKIMQFMHLYRGRPQRSIVGAFEIFTICNSSDEREESPSWRSLGGFPPQFSNETTEKNPVGSYLKGGIHWLFCDGTGDSIFISRLDLDTEEFGRVEVPQASNFKTNGKLNLNGMSLGVSDGYLNICACLFSEECDIWVMKDYDSWTKQFVVRSPVAVMHAHPDPKLGVDRNPHVQLLNYAAAKASTRGGAVSEVMLLYNRSPLFACATKGGHIRRVDLRLCSPCFIAHIPSFLSVKDVAKM